MKSSTKALLITGSLLLLAGILMVAVSSLFLSFNVTGEYPFSFSQKEEYLEDSFSDIFIKTTQFDVTIHPSAEDSPRIRYPNSKDFSVSLEIENNTLTLRETDHRIWYRRIFNLAYLSGQVELYLPSDDYQSLSIRSASGDITIEKGFSFDQLTLHAVSGSLDVTMVDADSVDCSTTSGNITLRNTKVTENIKLKTVSGDIEIGTALCNSLSASATSGDIELIALQAEKLLDTKAVSGSIRLSGCDADDIALKTTSGSIRGTILSEKIFEAHSTSGSITLPPDGPGGICKVQTTSGNIHLEIAK